MTTKDFLDRYDNNDYFTKEELEDLYWGDIVGTFQQVDEYTGELSRWSHLESKIYKVQDRYFEISRNAGNTEYQETEYDCQPVEVHPIEKTITAWETV